jgi:hypothetical protein
MDSIEVIQPARVAERWLAFLRDVMFRRDTHIVEQMSDSLVRWLGCSGFRLWWLGSLTPEGTQRRIDEINPLLRGMNALEG